MVEQHMYWGRTINLNITQTAIWPSAELQFFNEGRMCDCTALLHHHFNSFFSENEICDAKMTIPTSHESHCSRLDHILQPSYALH